MIIIFYFGVQLVTLLTPPCRTVIAPRAQHKTTAATLTTTIIITTTPAITNTTTTTCTTPHKIQVHATVNYNGGNRGDWHKQPVSYGAWCHETPKQVLVYLFPEVAEQAVQDFITGLVSEDYEADDVGLFLARGFQVLDQGEKMLADLINQQIVYDVAVELSTICDGILFLEMSKYNYSGDERRLVWKTESLSQSTGTTTKEKSLPTISENIDTPKQYLTCLRETRNATWCGCTGSALRLYQVSQGGNSSINFAKREIQQSMDLLHRMGDATIIDFADPISSTALEALRQQQGIAIGKSTRANTRGRRTVMNMEDASCEPSFGGPAGAELPLPAGALSELDGKKKMLIRFHAEPD
ncbi:3850_t:CDS:2 [Paraglomus occultum]|uniref:3850_t:CDS:1 n=1 Tax=Paraglomus occultum TaxID=144539 RepID=A0A9N8W7B3_9GLOM|nr:3850_t:CDS:2 [Paraglomus occultum]